MLSIIYLPRDSVLSLLEFGATSQDPSKISLAPFFLFLFI